MALVRARVHTDDSRVASGVVSSVLERVVATFQKHALLRVDQLSLSRRIAEEPRVEAIHVGEVRLNPDQVWIVQRRRITTGRQVLLLGDVSDGFATGFEVRPELSCVTGARK